MDLLISGVPDSWRAQLGAAVSIALSGHHEYDDLAVVATRLLNGEWVIFIADRNHLGTG